MVAEVLTEQHFYFSAHQILWKTMLELFEDFGSDLVIDPLILGQELARKKQLVQIGGAPALLALMEGTLTAANARHQAKVVREHATVRSVIQAASEVLVNAYERRDPPDEILANAEKTLAAVQVGSYGKEAKSLPQLLGDVADQISQRKKRGLVGVPTGLFTLDECLGGMRAGETTVLAARPGMGKTALAMTMAENAARCGKKVHFVSIEMPAEQLVERLWAGVAKVPAHILRKGLQSDEESQRLASTYSAIASLSMTIDYLPGGNLQQVRSTCRRAAMQKKCDLVVIDYLQLIESGTREKSREEEVRKVSRQIKAMAGQLDVPVLLLSQLNRESEKRPDKRPRLSDLRESGAIEQDADVILLLHRPGYYEGSRGGNKAEVIIGKNRHGPTGSIVLEFHKDTVRFEHPATPQDLDF